MQGLTPAEQREYDQAQAVIEAYHRLTGHKAPGQPSRFVDQGALATYRAAKATKRRLYDLARYRTKGSRKK